MQNFQIWIKNQNYSLVYEFFLNYDFNYEYLNTLSKWELFDLSVMGAILQHYPTYFYLTQEEIIGLSSKYGLNPKLEILDYKNICILNIYSLLSRLFIFTKSKCGNDSDFLIVFGYLFEIYWDVYLDYFDKYKNYGVDNIIQLGEKMMSIAKGKFKNPSFNNYDYILSNWENSCTKDEFLYIANPIRYKQERNMNNE